MEAVPNCLHGSIVEIDVIISYICFNQTTLRFAYQLSCFADQRWLTYVALYLSSIDLFTQIDSLIEIMYF